MKVISAVGGGGSTFIVNELEKANFAPTLPGTYAYKIFGRLLSVEPRLVQGYLVGLKLFGLYKPTIHVLRRPDAFWTDFSYHELATHDPDHPNYQQHLEGQKRYIDKFRIKRSAGIPIDMEAIPHSSLDELVKGYLNEVSGSKISSEVVLVAAHWGEYGIFKKLEMPAIYIIRDPFNALISHSKQIRHHKDYLRRSLTDINSQAWINAYLYGPAHRWVQHARFAFTHRNAIIVRYTHFPEDWQQVKGLPDISKNFRLKQNDITAVLSPESIDYIYEQVKDLCRDLKITLPI